MKNVLKFLQFLIVPVCFGLALVGIMALGMSAQVILGEFIIHFIGFFTLFVVRWVRHAKDYIFMATFSVFVGAAIEFACLCVMFATYKGPGVEPWVLALHLCMIFISVVALFAYSVALKAVEMIRSWNENNENGK